MGYAMGYAIRNRAHPVELNKEIDNFHITVTNIDARMLQDGE